MSNVEEKEGEDVCRFCENTRTVIIPFGIDDFRERECLECAPEPMEVGATNGDR